MTTILDTLCKVAILSVLTSVAAYADVEQEAAVLRNRAFAHNVAWEVLESLTTEVGPRLAGTEAEKRARDWAIARLKLLGFANVHVEPFEMPAWVRGSEHAEIVGLFAQPLSVTAMGYSAATPAAGLESQVVAFNSIDALLAAPSDLIKGKIVYITHCMQAQEDISGYQFYSPIRTKAPSIAARKGAAAILIRSLGVENFRSPHTGVTVWEANVSPIPAAALSIPDSEQIERLLSMRGPVRLKLVLTPTFVGQRESGNVIAEVPGLEPSLGIVVAGAHLDSWDLGTGASDDGAGVAITLAAATTLLEQPTKPRRTVRIVLWGAEEFGNLGTPDYARRHHDERHAFEIEADSGAGRIVKLLSHMNVEDADAYQSMIHLLEPLGVVPADNAGLSLVPSSLGLHDVPSVQPRQDLSSYMSVHHTMNDTLDRIDPHLLSVDVAAWSAILWMAANTSTNLSSPVISATQ